MKRKKRNNPGTSTLLLLGAAGAAAYYFLVYKKKEEEKAVVKQIVAAAVASPAIAGGITGKQTGYTLPLLDTRGRLSQPSFGSLSQPLTLSGGSLGSGGAGSLR